MKPKKRFGQHFLIDLEVAATIARLGLELASQLPLLEIGAGRGAITQFLIEKDPARIFLSEIDKDCLSFLEKLYGKTGVHIIPGDFLAWQQLPCALKKAIWVGNLPYNISNLIFFRLLTHNQQVPGAVFMIQEEVASRIVSPPGKKSYGILSVLLQTFYETSYQLSVPPTAFHPAPKIRSGIIQLVRKRDFDLTIPLIFFIKLVKSSFQHRRKTLGNNLRHSSYPIEKLPLELLRKRPEQIPIEGFVKLAQKLFAEKKN